MPRVTAGSFVSFAYERSARAKAAFVQRAVEQQRSGYDPPPDYWFRLRSPLISMISKSNYTSRAVALALAKVPEKRRDDFARIFTGFLAAWPQRQPVPTARPRLSCVIGDTVITCQPHAAVKLGGRLWLLRFLYPVNAAASSKAAAEFELLRRASAGRGRPGLLHVISGRILEPTSPRDLGPFLAAEADEYTRLWRRYGGPLDET